jgi:serine/threonine-protein kinase RsbW
MYHLSDLNTAIAGAVNPDHAGIAASIAARQEVDNLTTIVLETPATLEHVTILSRCACTLVESIHNLEEPEINLYNLELAIQEIAVNIVKHAYAQSKGRIQMTMHLEEEPLRLTIFLHDTGKSFDPALVPPPRLGELQEHGFGLFLVRQLMDVVDYQSGPAGNMWRLVKNIPIVMQQS